MIGVIADDTTGANDVGIMFAKGGLRTAVLAHDAPDPLPLADVLVLDTDSRLDPAAAAAAKVTVATRRLQGLGCTFFYKKTCSVLRGHLGVEADAMMTAAGGRFAIVCAAYPKNGRQTRDGVHTVHGERLERSPFAQDPVHPTRESNLLTILGAQTRRPVGLIALETVRAGEAVLRDALARHRAIGGYCVVDAVDQSDLVALARASHDWPWHVGSSALAEELTRFWERPAVADVLGEARMSDPNGVLIVSGSLTPQTRAQTAILEASGSAAICVDSRSIFDAKGRRGEIQRVVEAAAVELRRGRDVLVKAAQDEMIVAQTKAAGAQSGLDQLATSKAVSAALAEIAEGVVRATELKRLIVAGGDTSGSLCRRLGIYGNWVLQEIAPGVPSGLAIGRPMLLVLKAGGFGADDFLVTAVRHLRNLTAPLTPASHGPGESPFTPV